MASNTSKLAQEVLDYSKQIAKLREELTKLKKGTVDYEVVEKRLTEVEKKAKKAKDDLLISTGKLNEANGNHKQSIDKAKNALEQYNNVTKKTTGGLAEMALGFLKTIATVGKFFLAYQALNLVISAFRELVVGSVETFVKFEDTLGKVQAVTSATAADMGNISEAIRTTAVETRFTATEIADLAVSLGKLGATAQEIPYLLRPISTAAQAVGEDVATVGEAILKTNNQFGISAKDSVITSAIFADAINTSALSLSSLSTALQYVGPLASQVGLSLADTSAYMKVLADNGFTASKIGTGLRNIFIELKESGKPLIETLKELADENISLSEAVELVGKRSAGQLSVLLENIDIIEKSTDVTKALTQARVAEAAQMKTTAAQADVLKAIYENLQLSVGKSIADNEILLNSIGALDSGAEQMLRKQIALSQVFSRTGGTEAYERALKSVMNNGVEPLTATLKLLEEVGIGSSESLQKRYRLLADDLTLTEGEAQSLLISFARTSKNVDEFRDKVVNAFIQQGYSLRSARDEARQYVEAFDGLKDIVTGIEGITNAIKQDSDVSKNNELIQKERQKITDKYEVTIKRISHLEAQGLNQTKEKAALEKRIKADREKERETLKGIRSEYSGLNLQVQQNNMLGILTTIEERKRLADLKKQIELGEVRIDQYGRELKGIGAISEESEEAYEKRKREQLDLANKDIKRFEKRKRLIEADIRALNEATQREIDHADSLFDLEIQAANTNDDILNARRKREQSVLDAQEKQYIGLFDILEDIVVLTNDADTARDQFIKQAKAQDYGTDQIDKIVEIFEKFGDNLDLTEAGIQKLASSLVNLDEFEYVGGKINDAGASVGLFKEQLQQLQKQYGKNFAQSRAYIKAQEKLKEEEVASLELIKQGLDLTTESGRAAAAIIDKQIEGVKNAGAGIKTVGEEAAEVFKGTFVQAASTALNAIEEFNKTAYENTINSLNAQKDAIAEKASFEEDVLKSQLDSQLISQEEYAARLEQIKKKEAQRANAVDKKIFDAQNKRDKQQATSNYILALASIVPNLITNEGKAEPTSILIMQAITAALATAAYSAQLNAIDQRKFFPRKFADGGMVYGPSHEQGGVPFTVQGRGGYEMEGGEYIVNKKAAAKYRSLLDQINQTKFQPSYKFATGGPIRVEENAQKQIDLLEAIAEATTGTAINTGRPVRAFVSSSDLQNDTNARRIKDRNSNI